MVRKRTGATPEFFTDNFYQCHGRDFIISNSVLQCMAKRRKIVELLQKEIKFLETIRKYNIFILIFTLVLITNFNAWYIMWLFPTMFFLKGKAQETILALSYTSQIANFSSFALHSEEQILGIPFLAILIVGTVLIKLMNTKIERTEDGKIKLV